MTILITVSVQHFLWTPSQTSLNNDQGVTLNRVRTVALTGSVDTSMEYHTCQFFQIFWVQSINMHIILLHLRGHYYAVPSVATGDRLKLVLYNNHYKNLGRVLKLKRAVKRSTRASVSEKQ
jgi:hypothetical protein